MSQREEGKGGTEGGEGGGAKVEIPPARLVAADDPSSGGGEAASLTPSGERGAAESREKTATLLRGVPTVCGHENKFGCGGEEEEMIM